MGPISATGLPRSVTTIRSPRPTRRKYALSSFFRTRTETFMINVATMATSGGQHMPAVNQPDLQVSQATAHLWSPMSSRGCATRGSDDAPPPADAPALDRKPRRAGSDAEPHRGARASDPRERSDVPGREPRPTSRILNRGIGAISPGVPIRAFAPRGCRLRACGGGGGDSANGAAETASSAFFRGSFEPLSSASRSRPRPPMRPGTAKAACGQG